MNEKVSIIIPTHKPIKPEQCLALGEYKDIEVIIVCEGLERSAQRNIGIDRATGKYLMFVDSDQVITPALVEDCRRRIKWRGGLYIPEIIKTPGWFGRLRNWERQFYTGTAVDVVRFVRAYRCPRFDESLHGPEDSDWDRRIEGGKGISKLPIFHYDNVGVLSFFKKKAYYTKSMARFAKKWPNDKILKPGWRLWGVYTERGKWRILLRSPFRALVMFAMLFVRGVIYLCGRKF